MLFCFSQLQRSLSYSESYGAYISQSTDFIDIWRNFADNGQAPLFYSLQKIWAHFFGYTDFSIRMLSVLISAIAILCLSRFLLAKKGAKAALISCILLVTSPALIIGATEAQPWAVSLMLAAASLFMLDVAIASNKNAHVVIYLLLALLGMSSGPSFAVFFLLQLGYATIQRNKKIVAGLSVLMLAWIMILINGTAFAVDQISPVKSALVAIAFFASIIFAKGLFQSKPIMAILIATISASITASWLLVSARPESSSKELYSIAYSFSADEKNAVVCAFESDCRGLDFYNSAGINIVHGDYSDLSRIIYIAPIEDEDKHTDFRLKGWKTEEYSAVSLGSSHRSYAIVRMSKK